MIAATAWLVVSATAFAADPVLIGVMTPDAKAAVETALAVINGKHEPMPVLFGQGGGLDRLGGAELHVIYGEPGRDPAVEAQRLVQQESVVALIGGSIDAIGPQIPFLSPLQSPANQKDLTWLFRLGPTPDLAAGSIFGFLGDRAKSVALVWDDTPFGRENAEAQRKVAEAGGVKIVADLKLDPAASSLAAEALVIAGVKPDAVIPSVSAEHAVLLLRALADQQVSPIVVGQGFQDTAFVTGAGPLAEGVFCVAGFAADVKARPALPMLDAAFRARTGKPLDEPAARVLMGTLLLADVINRAGTTKPLELRAALMDTNTPGDATVLPWQGIRFDDGARNVLATPAIQQVQGGAFRTVAPDGIAASPAIWKPK